MHCLANYPSIPWSIPRRRAGTWDFLHSQQPPPTIATHTQGLRLLVSQSHIVPTKSSVAGSQSPNPLVRLPHPPAPQLLKQNSTILTRAAGKRRSPPSDHTDIPDVDAHSTPVKSGKRPRGLGSNREDRDGQSRRQAKRDRKQNHKHPHHQTVGKLGNHWLHL